MSHHELDARRLLCPMPVIRTQNRVAELVPGDTLNVTCTDPGAANDIPAWCRINGHELIGIEQREDELVVSVRVGSGDD
jgi:tRNA 2-thiouridine synthesizing protein A